MLSEVRGGSGCASFSHSLQMDLAFPLSAPHPHRTGHQVADPSMPHAGQLRPCPMGVVVALRMNRKGPS